MLLHESLVSIKYHWQKIKIKEIFGNSCTVKSTTILGLKSTVTVKHMKTIFGPQSPGGTTGLDGLVCLAPWRRRLEVWTQWDSETIDLPLFLPLPLLLSLQSQALSLSIRFLLHVFSPAGLLNFLCVGLGLTKMQKWKLPGLLKAQDLN